MGSRALYIRGTHSVLDAVIYCACMSTPIQLYSVSAHSNLGTGYLAAQRLSQYN